jgi:hypothetical protein
MASSATPSVVCEDLYFVENGAGTYTGSIVLPAGSSLIDVIVHAEALWTAATSASMDVGDTADPDGFFTAINLKATDLLAGESLSFTHTGGQKGVDIDLADAAAGADHIRRRELSNTAERTVSAVVTSVGAGTAGRTRVSFIYTKPTNTKIVTQ